MMKIQRIYNQEDEYVIYHYIYGNLGSIYNERLYVFVENEVKEKVFDIRDKMDIYDFEVYIDNTKIAIASLREIDFENRKAMIFVSMINSDHMLNYYKNVIERMTEVAFGQLDLIRLEGTILDINSKQACLGELKKCGFVQEGYFANVDFFGGKKVGIHYMAKLRKGYFNDGDKEN